MERNINTTWNSVKSNMFQSDEERIHTITGNMKKCLTEHKGT